MLTRFRQDWSAIANCIYKDYPHLTTSYGVAIWRDDSAELHRFVVEYADYLNLKNPYFRIDIYPDIDGTFQVLEVNAAFVDGWGTALNLSRASGIQAQVPSFPACFACPNPDYHPELEVLVNEKGLFGERHQIMDWTGNPDCPTYVYGRVEAKSNLIYPYNGIEMDSKLNLAEFGQIWQGKRVKIPVFYTAGQTPWIDLPEDIYLKFVHKSGPESQHARFSVKKGKPKGKSPFLSQCYNEQTLIAQASIKPRKAMLEDQDEERTVQIVLLATRESLLGYVQYGKGDIITDNSIHGPLLLS